MCSWYLDGLLVGPPVDGVDGGRALDLDVPGLGERLLLHLQPEHSNFRQTFKSDRYNI